MKTLKLHRMALAAASLAMVASAANAIPENGLGGLTCCAEDLPYEVLDPYTDDVDGSWYRDAGSDGEAEVVGGGGGDVAEPPNSSTGG